MKYIKKIPAENEKNTKELLKNGWKVLKEPPSLGVIIAIAMPISIILMLITLLYFGMLFPDNMDFWKSENLSIEFTINLKTLLYIVGIWLYAFLHEVIHALTIPNAIRSNKTFLGINGFFGFVYSEETIKKERFILVAVMPLLILSFGVPLICKILGSYHGYLLLLCIINAGGACVDIFNIMLIIKQVPPKGMLVSNGMKTFYKS